MQLLTYKQLFDEITKNESEIKLEVVYPTTSDYEVQTPNGEWVKILGVMKKTGKSIEIETESGRKFHGELKHTIKNGNGEWVFLKDCKDILLVTGETERVVNKTLTDEIDFYDISIPYPHTYISPNGMIHHNTFTVLQTVKEEGLSKNEDFFIVKGKITTSELYRTLFMHREGKLLIFDDTDSVWADKDAANILKAALDSYEERTVSWFSPRTFNVSKLTDDEKDAYNEELDLQIGDPESRMKFPSEFLYNGRIIFISNLSYDKFDSAVLTRAAKIDMTLTDKQLFKRMEGILDHLGDKSVPKAVKREILEFLRQENTSGKLQGVSMRTFVAASDLYKSGLPNWKDLLGYI